MKGFNISSFESTQNAIALCKLYKDMGCDTIRWQFNAPFPELLLDREIYRSWLQSELAKLQEVISGEPGLVYIPDLHSTFGGVNDWTKEHYILEGQGLVQWKEDLDTIFSVLKGTPQVRGVDIVNEPWARGHHWRRLLEAEAPYLKSLCATKKLYVQSPYGIPSRVIFVPKIDRGILPSVHIWPRFALRLGEGEQPGDEKFINSMSCFDDLDRVRQYQVDSRRKVMIGELGCTYGVGMANQRKYMKRALKYCVGNNLQVCVHGEAGNPHYKYEENGILEIVADVFRGK